MAAPPRGLVDDVWRLIYTRAHVEVDRARPYIDRDHAGILVYAHPLDALRALLIVETGDRLVGAVGAFGRIPRLGSSVRLAAAAAGGSSPWRLIVDEEFPLAIDVRFDRTPDSDDRRVWIATLRNALAVIRTAEAVRREGIAARRRALPPFVEPTPSDEIVRERIEALRAQAARETDYTADEADQLETARRNRQRGTFAAQRRAFELETALVKTRQARFDARMRELLQAFRAELPAFHVRVRSQQAAQERTRAELQRLENAYGESRARSQATYAASRWLDALADAPFVVFGLSAPLDGLAEPGRANDVLRAIALLARALPRSVGPRIAV